MGLHWAQLIVLMILNCRFLFFNFYGCFGYYYFQLACLNDVLVWFNDKTWFKSNLWSVWWMMDMCIHDDDVVITSVNYDDDTLLYEHEICCWTMIMLLRDDSSGGELLSLSQCIFCLLSGGNFKHYVIVAFMCCDMHSLYRYWWWKWQVEIRAWWIGDLSRIRAGWIQGSSRVNLVLEWINCWWYGTTCIWV